MSDSLSTEPYKGVRDFYPAEFAKRAAVFEVIRKTARLQGYEEYDASPLERAELYESKGNEEIVNEQTYTFTDRGERRVTLRPEMTPSLARMVAHKRRELVFPLRWFSIGNRFRYERPQRGRLREFYQTDIDLVGLPEGPADIEVVALAAEILKAFGATESDFTVRINSRSLLTAACRAAGLTDEDAAREYWRLVDRKAKMTAADFEKERAAFTADPLAVIEAGTDETVAAERAKVENLVAALRNRGMTNVSFDMEIVRGFDYYTGMVFEINDTNPENPRALFGGGRYDGLVALFGGDPIPAAGFAFGDVTLMDFLETHGLTPDGRSAPDVFLATMDDTDADAVTVFATQLRAQNLHVFVNLRAGRGVGDQVKEADRRNIPYFIAFGPEEAASAEVRIKHLATGMQTTLATAVVAEFLRGELGR